LNQVGNKLNIGYSLIADIRKRVLDGETADVIILSRPVMDELDKQQKFASGSMTNVVGTPVALAIRAGAPKPDVSSADALKRTLLAAKSIVYADPAKGGASGVYFAKVVGRLGNRRTQTENHSGAGRPGCRGRRQGRGRDRGRTGLGDCAGGGSGTAWPAARRVCQHDGLYRRDWRNQQRTGGGEIVDPVPHWAGCQAGVQRQGLSARVIAALGS
jgi:hypothetical protein